MNQEKKDRGSSLTDYDRSVARAIAQSESKKLLVIDGDAENACYLSACDAMKYGRQSPDKEKLIRLIKFYERVKWEKFSPDPRHVFSLDHIVDQFLQSEASKEK